MGDGRGFVMHVPPARQLLCDPCADGSHPGLYILALCFASSLCDDAPPGVPPVGSLLGLRNSCFSSLKRGVERGSSGSPLDCEADSQQGSEREGSRGSLIPGLDDQTAARCIAFSSRSNYGALALTHRGLRDLIRSGEIYNIRRSLGVVEQWVYMFANGDSSWTAFDPKRARWMRLPLCATDYAFIHSDKESLSAGTQLLWIGKEALNYSIFNYDLVSNSWERGPPMNESRCLYASASCGEFAFVAGGNRNGVILKSAERYSSIQRRWEMLPDMNVARQKSSGCFMDGKFYVIGGRDSAHRRVWSGEEFDPVSRTWRIIPDMFPAPAGRELVESSPPLVAVVRNQLYAIDSTINILKVYDKANNTWRPLGSVPVRADSFNGWGLAFKALGDELYVIGGYRYPGRGEGMAMFSWMPGTGMDPPVWGMVTFMSVGMGTFLSNCAVMAC